VAKPTPDPTEHASSMRSRISATRRFCRKADGTTRFEIVDGKRTSRWFVTAKQGHLKACLRRGAATRLRLSGRDKATSRRSPWASSTPSPQVLRGDLAIEGDWRRPHLDAAAVPRPATSSSDAHGRYAWRRG
jgi:hypothetical protein